MALKREAVINAYRSLVKDKFAPVLVFETGRINLFAKNILGAEATDENIVLKVKYDNGNEKTYLIPYSNIKKITGELLNNETMVRWRSVNDSIFIDDDIAKDKVSEGLRDAHDAKKHWEDFNAMMAREDEKQDERIKQLEASVGDNPLLLRALTELKEIIAIRRLLGNKFFK